MRVTYLWHSSMRHVRYRSPSIWAFEGWLLLTTDTYGLPLHYCQWATCFENQPCQLCPKLYTWWELVLKDVRKPRTKHHLEASRSLLLVWVPSVLIALFVTDSELLNLDSKSAFVIKETRKTQCHVLLSLVSQAFNYFCRCFSLQLLWNFPQAQLKFLVWSSSWLFHPKVKHLSFKCLQHF